MVQAAHEDDTIGTIHYRDVPLFNSDDYTTITDNTDRGVA